MYIYTHTDLHFKAEYHSSLISKYSAFKMTVKINRHTTIKNQFNTVLKKCFKKLGRWAAPSC